MKFDTIVRRIRAFPLPQRTKKGYEREKGREEGGLIPPFFSLFDFRSVRQDAQAGVNEWPNRGTQRRETTCEKTPRETATFSEGGDSLTPPYIRTATPTFPAAIKWGLDLYVPCGNISHATQPSSYQSDGEITREEQYYLFPVSKSLVFDFGF